MAKAMGLLPASPGVHRGFIADRRVTMLLTGMGADAARGALERHAASNGKPPVLAVSAGLCGALQPGMSSADVVVDAREAEARWASAALRTSDRVRVPVHMGAVTSSLAVLGPDEKLALGKSERAAAVDMETAAVRAWASGRGVEFLAVRAVLDAVGESVPTAAPEGGSLSAVGRFLAGHWTELPLLLLTGWRARRAMDALGRFLPEYLASPGDDE